MKKYLKGFGKGFLILFVFVMFLLILELVNINFEKVALIGNLIIPLYIFSVYKRDKQPNVWIIISILVGFFSLPFYFGAVEVSKDKK